MKKQGTSIIFREKASLAEWSKAAGLRSAVR